MCICACVHVCTGAYVHMCICAYVYMCMCVYTILAYVYILYYSVYVYLCICVIICVYVYMCRLYVLHCAIPFLFVRRWAERARKQWNGASNEHMTEVNHARTNNGNSHTHDGCSHTHNGNSHTHGASGIIRPRRRGVRCLHRRRGPLCCNRLTLRRQPSIAASRHSWERERGGWQDSYIYIYIYMYMCIYIYICIYSTHTYCFASFPRTLFSNFARLSSFQAAHVLHSNKFSTPHLSTPFSRRFNAQKSKANYLGASQSLPETSPGIDCKAFSSQRKTAQRGKWRGVRIGSRAQQGRRPNMFRQEGL